jgi:hypothetical protein
VAGAGVIVAASPAITEWVASMLVTGPEMLITTPATSVNIVARIFILDPLLRLQLTPVSPGCQNFRGPNSRIVPDRIPLSGIHSRARVVRREKLVSGLTG